MTFVFDKSLPFNKDMKNTLSPEDFKVYNRYYIQQKFRKKQTKTFCVACDVWVSPNNSHSHKKTNKHKLKQQIYDLSNLNENSENN